MKIDQIRKCIDGKRTVIFGCGSLGRKVYKYLSKMKIDIDAVVDNDSNKWGGLLFNKKIESPIAVTERFKDAYYIVAIVNYQNTIKLQLMELGVSETRILIAEEKDIDEAIIMSGKYLTQNQYFIFNLPISISFKSFIEYVRFTILDRYYRIKMNSIVPRQKVKKYKVAICAIFKNESSYLKEWIEFHRIIGIEHFYLYNNFSEDNYLEILQPYIISGIVTLTDWPVPQGQIAAYKDCFEKYSEESQWIGMIDIDEFVVPIKYENIYSFLEQFAKRGSVLIYWKNFGTSGFITRDKKNLVIEDFTVCWNKYTDVGKCFVNTNFICDFSKDNYYVHHEAWTINNGKLFPPVNCFDHISILHRFNIVNSKDLPIQINHYLVKSLEELKIKIGKGDVFFKANPDKEKYCMEYERNNISADYSVYKYLVQLKVNMAEGE